MSSLGIVVIGRNEGARLKRCIASLPITLPRIYVDSGSTDGSLALAGSFGLHLLSLDPTKKFTAARARNEGFRKLIELHAELDLVQFIDGDCELNNQWLGYAENYLKRNPDTAIACGRRREMYPRASIYNFLCDVEWDTPVGPCKACGGDFLVRVSVFKQLNGFNETLIAGEEPELGLRARAAGWKLCRLDTEMTLHDAAIHAFSQWWKRIKRSGFAYAQGASLHGAPPERHWVWETRRALIWGLLAPAVCLGATIAFWPFGCAAWLIYPLQLFRLARRAPGSVKDRIIIASFQIISRFAEVAGQIQFWMNKYRRIDRSILEYK